MVETLNADVRYALRQWLRYPTITLIAVLTLAIGFAANATIFTLTWNIVLRSLPVPRPGELVNYEMLNGDNDVVIQGLSGLEYDLLRQRQHSCTDLLAWLSDRLTVRSGTQKALLPVQFLTANSFRVLELQPILGRGFDENEQGGQAQGVPAILSYEYWQSSFHGDSRVLDQTLFLNDHPVTIVGVMPRAFRGLTANFGPDIYVPMSFANTVYSAGFTHRSSSFSFFVLGRLKPGATLHNAAVELAALAPTLRRDADPSGVYLNHFFKDSRLVARPGRSGISWVKTVYERPLLVLEALVLFLLLLCALNTALVLLARVSGRQREYSLRLALGAGGTHLIHQVLVETVLLAIPGFIGGTLLGSAGARLLVGMLGEAGSPQQMNLHVNAIILAFNLAATSAVVLGAGLFPALRAARTAPALDLRSVDHFAAARRLGGWVITVQIALSFCLVSVALLFGGSLLHIFTAHSGFTFGGATTAHMDTWTVRMSPAQARNVSRNLLPAIQSQPGVSAAAYVSPAPLSTYVGASSMFALDSHHAIHSDADIVAVDATPGFFAAADTHLLSGSAMLPPPGASPVCVVSRSLAVRFFPHETPIGRLLYAATAGTPDGAALTPENSCRIVAVAENSHYLSLEKPAPDIVYTLHREDAWPFSNADVFVRAATSPLALAALRNAAAFTAPGVVDRLRTFSAQAAASLSRERMLVSLSSCFALLALLLSGLGLYGVLTRAVALRTREFGIRIALGARRSQILVSLAARTLLQSALGLAAGAVLAALFLQGAQRLLRIPVIAGAGVFWLTTLLLATVIGAALYPAWRRAITVDPLQSLRAE